MPSMLPDTSSITMRRIGLWRLVELNDRLGRALVANLEVLLLERRDQPAVAIGHRGEDTDGITGAAKDWLLLFRLLGCADDGQGTRDECQDTRQRFMDTILRSRGVAGSQS